MSTSYHLVDLLFDQNKDLANKMDAVAEFDHADNGQQLGMKRLASGRVVLLRPKCHCRYDGEDDAKLDRCCSIKRKDLQTRGRLLFEENKEHADKMAAVPAFNHANNGCGRLRYEELSQQATIPEDLKPVEMDLAGPSADHASALRRILMMKSCVVPTVAIWAQQDEPPIRQALHPLLSEELIPDLNFLRPVWMRPFPLLVTIPVDVRQFKRVIGARLQTQGTTVSDGKSPDVPRHPLPDIPTGKVQNGILIVLGPDTVWPLNQLSEERLVFFFVLCLIPCRDILFQYTVLFVGLFFLLWARVEIVRVRHYSGIGLRLRRSHCIRVFFLLEFFIGVFCIRPKPCR